MKIPESRCSNRDAISEFFGNIYIYFLFSMVIYFLIVLYMFGVHALEFLVAHVYVCEYIRLYPPQCIAILIYKFQLCYHIWPRYYAIFL